MEETKEPRRHLEPYVEVGGSQCEDKDFEDLLKGKEKKDCPQQPPGWKGNTGCQHSLEPDVAFMVYS